MHNDPTQIVDDAMTLIGQQSAELATLRARIAEKDAELEELSHRLCDAEGALWRVAPNTHTIPSDHPLGKKTPDSFEGSGETYRAAYERVQSELVATRQELGEVTRLAVEAMELARAVLAQSNTAGHNVPGPTPEDIEKAFWALDAALDRLTGERNV